MWEGALVVQIAIARLLVRGRLESDCLLLASSCPHGGCVGQRVMSMGLLKLQATNSLPATGQQI